MSCPGLHCPGCGGGEIPIASIAAAAIAVEVAANLPWWLIPATIVSGFIAVACAVLLAWGTKRREAAYAASDQHRQIMAWTSEPQVTRRAAPAIEQHIHHYHIYPGAERVPMAGRPVIQGEVER